MVLNVRANILSSRNKKAITILIGFLMIVSGIFAATLTVVGEGNSFGPRRGGSRLPDLDNTTNDFAPVLTDNTQLAASYLNNVTAWVLFNVTANDDDESNLTTTPLWNGTNIASVKINLTEFALGILDMNFDGNYSDPLCNATRFEGYYTYNLTLPIPFICPPGDHNVTINATDNGLLGFEKEATGIILVVTVVQHNRNMTLDPPSPIEMVENGPDKYLELNTVFLDPDIPDENITDSLMFKVWDGDSWESSYAKENFTVTIAAGEPGNVTFHPITGKATLPAGENIKFKASDEGGHWKEQTVNVKITGVNNAPYWDNAPSTAVPVTEGTPTNVSVTAIDPDSTALTFTAYLFIDVDDTNTSWEIAVEELTPKVANLTLMFDDYEVMLDEVYGLSINLTVDDGEYNDSAIIELDLSGANDDPTMSYAADIITDLELDLEATEDEEYNLSFFAIDDDIAEDLTYGFEVVEYPTNAVEASYDDTEKANITGYPAWAGLVWDVYPAFEAYEEFTTISMGEFLFMPDNNDVGEVTINFTVTDGTETLWIVTNISIANTNDVPFFTKQDSSAVTTGDMVEYTGANNVTVGDYLNFTIEADDDDLIHGAETLTFGANASLFSDGVLTKTKTDNTTADLSFKFPKEYAGTDIYNITVTDGDEWDWFLLKVEVWEEPEEPVEPTNNPPNKPTISGPTAGVEYNVGEVVTFNGTGIDPDGDTIQYKWDFDDGDSTGWLDSPGTTHTYTTNGTFTVTLTVRDPDTEINTATVTIEVVKEDVPDDDDDDEDDEGLLGMGKVAGIDVFLLLIIIIVVIVIVLVGVVSSKKKKAKAAAAAEEEALVPPPFEQPCTACGAIIPAGSPTCPACGAPAPPPAEAAPPFEQPCTACGVMIPTGSPTCPACGATAPPPAEAEPDVITCVTCGQVIPPGSATCPACGAPAPPAGPPSEEVPPAAPPPEWAPPEGAPPPPPPPEMLPAEAPPEPGAPPEAPAPAPAPPPPEAAPPEGAGAPPPQMIACPQCGIQIGVGATPCPGCGAQLNWG